jgi:hypothetical protein
MSAVPAVTSPVPAVTAQDLELEHAELLPARETLWVPRLYPKGPVHFDPGGSRPPLALMTPDAAKSTAGTREQGLCAVAPTGP